MKNNIENESKGYQDLIDEIEKDQEKIIEELKYVLTGVVGGRQLSDQEYQCFVERAVDKNKFDDIAFNMCITESSAKTYYQRAIKKLEAEATRVTLRLKRK
tara:strand:- start:1097 stop:1399 length:303 start_codon:yes stop_codon:yes gene_type:complete